MQNSLFRLFRLLILDAKHGKLVATRLGRDRAPMPIAAANDSATADAHASCWAREAHGSWARVPRPGAFVPYETMTATADERYVPLACMA